MKLTTDSLLLSCALLVLCAAAIGVSHWWYSRKLDVVTRKLEKIDRTRREAGQYATQTRQQLEQLAAQLAKKPQQHEVDMQPASNRMNKAQLEASLASNSRPALPANGFADTVVV